MWLLLWAVASVLLAQTFHRKEEMWLETRRKDPELAKWMTREGAHEERKKSVQIERERRRSEKEASAAAVDARRRPSQDVPRQGTATEMGQVAEVTPAARPQ